jgi:ATP/maltotriose-dependent transcriptional regulator MalT
VPLLTQALEQTTAIQTVFIQVLCGLSLGESYLLAGRLEEAEALGQQTLALAREHQERGHEVYALRLLGKIAAQRDPPESQYAEIHYEEAIALAEALGMRPLQVHGRLGLGTLYTEIGWQEQASAELSIRKERYYGREQRSAPSDHRPVR